MIKQILNPLSGNFDTISEVTIGTANGLSLSSQALSLQAASGSQPGALSSTDWNTFNNKQSTSEKGAANGYASLDAGGLVPITQIPPAALERLVVVANQTARFALTTATVQNGDTVKQTDIAEMFFVIDDTQLSSAAGYSVYTAGTAASVPWSGITGTPTTLSAYGITDAVPSTRTVAGHALSSDVTVSASDVGLGSVTNDAQLKSSQLDTDGTLTANSDIRVASQKATKTYVDAHTSPLNTKGDLFTFSTISARQPVPADYGYLVPDTGTTTGWRSAPSTATQGCPGKNYIQYADFENNATTGWIGLNSGGSAGDPQIVMPAGTALTTKQFVFTVTAANATVGATYTNNTQTFTVLATIAASTALYCSGTGAPSASGTLTKAGGSGDATISFGSVSGNTTANGVLLTSQSASSLSGTYSLQWEGNTGINTGDTLLTSPFTIDISDRAKVLSFKFNYSTILAPSSGGQLDFSGSSNNTFYVVIYDVTNGAWVNPAGAWSMVQGSGVGIAQGTFQTASNGSIYQFGVRAAHLTGADTKMYFDDFYVGPQALAFGPAMSDWQAYAPTITGFGTPTLVSAASRRVGGNLEGYVYFNAGTPTAVQAQISIGYAGGNSNAVIDASKLSTNQVNAVGYLAYGANSASSFTVLAPLSNQSYVNIGIQGSASIGLGAANGNAIIGAGAGLSIHYSVPIVGWSSNTAQSADTDTRVVAASMYLSVNRSPAQYGAIIYDIVDVDKTGSYNASTGVYTAGTTGQYVVHTGAFTSAGTPGIRIYVNGAFRAYLMSVAAINTIYSGSTSVSLNAGDQIFLAPDSGSCTFTGSANKYNYFAIERISGPAVVQATETVAMRATTSSARTMNSAGTLAVYETVSFDSHGTYNASTGIYTCPVSGTYRATASFITASTTWGLGNNAAINLYKNGSIYSVAASVRLAAAATVMMSGSGSTTVKCTSGDTLSFYAAGDTTTTLLASQPIWNYVNIERIGN